MTDTSALGSYGENLNVAVVGASGGIGNALSEAFATDENVSRVLRFARRPAPGWGEDGVPIDIEDEGAIVRAAESVQSLVAELHIVVVATGVLHGPDGLSPEKTWRQLSSGAFEQAFRINTTGPALVAKHFLPLLSRDRRSSLSVLSARVGSIEDNQLGGWHAYRASKAALNMIVRNLSIELRLRNPQALCVALHPGTVDTQLSKPFQRGVKPGRLFEPGKAARSLIAVLDGLEADDTGGLFAWDGSRIPS